MVPIEAKHSVSFVLPAFNEEANIVEVLRRTVDVAKRLCDDFEVLVVDDGSTDRTAELVTSLSDELPDVALIRHPHNRGYGEALRSGLAAATFEFVFFTDADNQFDMEEFALLLPWAQRADVVAGYRTVRSDPAVRRLNAWAWNRLVRWLFYVPVRDIDCAFKLLRRSALQDITIESRGAMINTEIMVKLARRGCTVVEVGVTHSPRRQGEAQGAKLKVIARALHEVGTMYSRLSSLSAQPDEAPVTIGWRSQVQADETRLAVEESANRTKEPTGDDLGGLHAVAGSPDGATVEVGGNGTGAAGNGAPGNGAAPRGARRRGPRSRANGVGGRVGEADADRDGVRPSRV